ncbi:hypothetical protein Q5P01_024974 [Channa striata]|uniref:Uncharacterized protein n=1 Tax=Channa striata TaxID=64152 RepID=A0AA88IMC2_CHASR|nr:hypothetical protein Q5P01_024974 [Channa striata]
MPPPGRTRPGAITCRRDSPSVVLVERRSPLERQDWILIDHLMVIEREAFPGHRAEWGHGESRRSSAGLDGRPGFFTSGTWIAGSSRRTAATRRADLSRSRGPEEFSDLDPSYATREGRSDSETDNRSYREDRAMHDRSSGAARAEPRESAWLGLPPETRARDGRPSPSDAGQLETAGCCPAPGAARDFERILEDHGEPRSDQRRVDYLYRVAPEAPLHGPSWADSLSPTPERPELARAGVTET